MLEIRQASAIRQGDHYLTRRGLWFRPEAAGYTDDIAQAGTFAAETARDYLEKCEGVGAVPVASARRRIHEQIQASLDRTSKLCEILKAMP